MTVRPDSVNVKITDSGHVAIQFGHEEIPEIVLGYDSAQQVGATLGSCAYKAEQISKTDTDES